MVTRLSIMYMRMYIYVKHISNMYLNGPLNVNYVNVNYTKSYFKPGVRQL